ncbi:MAG: cation transporter [Bryobacterales bacterium]|nr:cation transporter [Bryobacterales bacterium]
MDSAAPESGGRQHRGRLGLVFALTTLLMGLEAAAGLWTNSLALLADAGHMLTDAGSLGLSLLAIHFAGRNPTPGKSYGYYRAEILAALVNAAMLLVISIGILYEAWKRFQSPPEVMGMPVLIIAAAGLVVNLTGAFLLRQGSGESLNVQGAYLEVLSDTLGSAGVIVAGFLIWLKGWYVADPLVSAAISLLILPRTWTLLGEAMHILMEGAPAHVDQAALTAAANEVSGVLDLHDLHVWTITSGFTALSAHVTVAPEADFSRVLNQLQALLRDRFNITHSTLQLEAGKPGDCRPPI